MNPDEVISDEEGPLQIRVDRGSQDGGGVLLVIRLTGCNAPGVADKLEDVIHTLAVVAAEAAAPPEEEPDAR